jgi:hypothetical protein
MKIKTENGEVNVASQGQSNLNTVLGAVGIHPNAAGHRRIA